MPLQVAPGGVQPPPAPVPPPAAAVPPPPASVAPPPGVSPSNNDLCPNCHARMAPDQRYCLTCGNRRGEPRLPFMDAVKFMESMHQPPAAAAAAAAPQPPRQRFAAGTTLIAGVATLVLAIGVGVLIGQSGENGSQQAAQPQEVVINAGGGGGTTPGEENGASNKNKAKGEGKQKNKQSSIETGSSGTSEGAEEVLKPSGDVKLAPPDTKVGGDCEKGTAGCSDGGKFDGSFFGE